MGVYPVSLILQHRPCVVIGGGRIAEGKVRGLLEAGAVVRLISPALTPGLQELASAGRFEWIGREYRTGDLAGAFLAIAATDHGAVNRAVWAEAESRHVLLNAVDDVEHCHFHAPAIHRQGDLVVAISTAGKAPALAVRIKERIAELIGPAYGQWLDLLGTFREALVAAFADPRQRTAVWYRLVDSQGLDLVRRGDLAGARRHLDAIVQAAGRGSPEPPGGSDPVRSADPSTRRSVVYLVGAGPGDPGLITARGLEVLRRADVVVYDRLIHPALLREAPVGAERVFAGKRSHGDSGRQESINRLLIHYASAGRLVVRLKGGDPFVFGRGAEEAAALRAAGIRCEVVPGVTSAIAVPAAAGIPVTSRHFSSGFAVVTGQECEEAGGLDWDALAAVPTLVVLMGVERLGGVTSRLLRLGRDPATPAAVIQNGTLETQRTVVGTLATIEALARDAAVEPPATLVVGEVVRVRESVLGLQPDLSLTPAELAPGADHD